MKPIKIFLVDDHPAVREGIKAAIEKNSSFIISGEAENGVEFLERMGNGTPDLVILDISLPDFSGLELSQTVRERWPRVKILFLSMFNRSDYILEAIRTGAVGYVTKETSPGRIMQGIEQIFQGEYFFDKPAMDAIIKKALERPQKLYEVADQTYETLTGREQEIMRLLAEGFSVKKIAQTLFISYRTVENHRTSIFKKLNLNNSVELVHYARKLGIIDLE